jgi:hypothetical protein
MHFTLSVADGQVVAQLMQFLGAPFNAVTMNLQVLEMSSNVYNFIPLPHHNCFIYSWLPCFILVHIHE